MGQSADVKLHQQLPINISEVCTSISISCCIFSSVTKSMQTTSATPIRENSFVIPQSIFYWKTRKDASKRKGNLKIQTL